MKVTAENLTEALVVLKDKMHAGVATFTYIKKDGTERVAKGTLNIETMGEENAPKGTGMETPDYTTRYFDVDKSSWRSFQNVNLVNIED